MPGRQSAPYYKVPLRIGQAVNPGVLCGFAVNKFGCGTQSGPRYASSFLINVIRKG